ncbi:MAG: hypothetical protein K2K73_03225 [Ureaplasma sp.]|nr:hypothetical protein [Ureaplasma sp.]
MKKKKLITSLAISAGLITTATISAIAITSCSVDNDYNPDTSTKIMEVIPNKEAFNKMKVAVEKMVEYMKKIEPDVGDFNASIKVDKNVFYFNQWNEINSIEMKFIFNNTNNVEKVVSYDGQIDKEQSKTITLEQAKQEIYSYFTIGFN